MDRKIRLLLVTDKLGQQHKLKGIFEKEGFNVVVTGDIGVASRFIFQECNVVLCRALMGDAVPNDLIKECIDYRVPIVAMGSNPAHIAEWRKFGVEHFFDSDCLMGTDQQAISVIKSCVETLRSLVNSKSQ